MLLSFEAQGFFFFFFLFPPNIFFPRSTKLPSKGHFSCSDFFLIMLLKFFFRCFKSVLDKNIQLSEIPSEFQPLWEKQDFGLHHIFYGLRGMLMWEVARLWLY